MKSQPVADALAPLRAVDWQTLPPPAQRELFAGLTSVMLEMMKADITPMGQRRTNVDRDRRTGENEEKLALIETACQSLLFEAMDEAQLGKAFDLLYAGACAMQGIIQSRGTIDES